MYSLFVENKYTEKLELTHNPAYSISNIDGLNPPEATINTSKNAGADGSVFNSAYTNSRQIVITMAVNAPVEANRIALYRYFKPKQPVRLYYKNSRRDLYIDGYVQHMDINYFDKKETVQIVVQCPLPYFNGSNSTVQEFNSVEALFEFEMDLQEEGLEFSVLNPYVEKSIYNYGDVETGAIINIQCVGLVVNPVLYDLETNQKIGFNTSLVSGDLVVINTRQGQKAADLYREGVKASIVGALIEGSEFIQFLPEDNLFTVLADEGAANMQITFDLIDQYEGV